MSHNSSPKPFLGHLLADVKHASEPRMYPTHFYVFEDTTSAQILRSYVTLDKLGIVAFKVPKLAATSQVDNLSIPTSQTPSGLRKTTKTVTFLGPIVEDAPSQCNTPSPTSHHGRWKTASPMASHNSSPTTTTQCKPPATPINQPLNTASPQKLQALSSPPLRYSHPR